MAQQLEIIQETAEWIALHKPSGLLSIPDREGKEISLKQLLLNSGREIYTIHRLDKDTSGIIVFAKNPETHKALSLQFEGRAVEKYYYGLVHGEPYQDEDDITIPIIEHPVQKGVMATNKKGKASHTHYRVEERFGLYSWLHFQIFTGRTHQIRVHCKYIGHSIVCDETYGQATPVLLSNLKKKFKLSKEALEERPLLNRLALHAARLVFTDPVSDEQVQLEAPISKDLRATLQQLRKWKKG